MSSKLIFLLAAGVAISLAAFATFVERIPWTDDLLRRDVQRKFQGAHFLADNDSIEVSVTSKQVTLEGKLDSDTDKADLGRRALEVAGVRVVHNNIETLNTEALAQLKQLLASPPWNLGVEYVIQDRGTILLSGSVGDELTRKRITSLVGSIAGVQRVENHMGAVPTGLVVEQRIRDIMRLDNIYFDFNKWTIRDDSEPALAAIAEVLNEHAEMLVRIEGHTDSIGGDPYNQELSHKRAEAVREALIARGVAAERVEARGYGESLPIAPNESPEGRAENRRIEFKAITGASQPPLRGGP